MADYLHDCLLDLLHIIIQTMFIGFMGLAAVVVFGKLVDVFPDVVYLIREIL